MKRLPHAFSDAINLTKQALALYDKQTLEYNTKVKQLEEQILVLTAQLNTSNRLLEVSEAKRQQLLQQLDTNIYKGQTPCK